MTLPDFEEWAESCIDNGEGGYSATVVYVAEGLQQAYEQGKTLGYREGYENGVNYGWVDVQDADTEWVNENTKKN